MSFTRLPCADRSFKLLIAALVIVAVAILDPAGLAAQDARQERARVQSERAQVAAQVDALEADEASVTAALSAIELNVRSQQAASAEATRVAAASAADAEAAARAAAASAAELDGLRERLARLALSAYVDPPGEDLLRRFEAGSAQEDATRRAFMNMRSGRDTDVIDQVRVTQRRLEDERRRAESARAAAEAARDEADAAVASLSAAKADQERFATQVRQRLDARLADASVLAGLDASLAARIRAEESAVAAAVARLAPPPAPRSDAPVQGGPTAPESPGPPSTSPPPTSPRPRPATPPLRTVGGITVNAAIADRVAGLLDAARADGIALGGSGYRDTSAQIALRRQNCGTSDYAVWDMPPDQCSPPTARPGMSMHELGLAIDFTANGRFISSRTDPGFVWLAANAGRFGFSNLPSEPWHWSTTGG